jgi:hypothetical protein
MSLLPCLHTSHYFRVTGVWGVDALVYLPVGISGFFLRGGFVVLGGMVRMGMDWNAGSYAWAYWVVSGCGIGSGESVDRGDIGTHSGYSGILLIC